LGNPGHKVTYHQDNVSLELELPVAWKIQETPSEAIESKFKCLESIAPRNFIHSNQSLANLGGNTAPQKFLNHHQQNQRKEIRYHQPRERVQAVAAH